MKKLLFFLIKTSFWMLFCFSVLIIASCYYGNRVMEGLKDPNVDISPYNGHVARIINPLLPRTSWSHTKPCALFIDEQKLIEQTLECANSTIWKDNPVKSSEVPIPACHVILRSSPDVYRDGLLNGAVTRFLGKPLYVIFGFYNPQLQELFVVENIDIEEIYRHEIQHHLLNVLPHVEEEGDHQHAIFKNCEPATYERSNKVKYVEQLLGINTD